MHAKNKVWFILMAFSAGIFVHASDQKRVEEIFLKDKITQADIDFLKKAKFDPYVTTRDTCGIKHFLIQKALEYRNEYVLEILDVLKNQGVDFTKKVMTNSPGMDREVQEGIFYIVNISPAVVQKLLDLGADPLQKHSLSGGNGLHSVAYFVDAESLKIVLEYLNKKGLVNKAIDEINNHNQTPLLVVATQFKDSQVYDAQKSIDLLIQYGANPLAVDGWKRDAVSILRENMPNLRPGLFEYEIENINRVRSGINRLIEKLEAYKKKYARETHKIIKKTTPLSHPLQNIVSGYALEEFGPEDVKEAEEEMAQEGARQEIPAVQGSFNLGCPVQ